MNVTAWNQGMESSMGLCTHGVHGAHSLCLRNASDDAGKLAQDVVHGRLLKRHSKDGSLPLLVLPEYFDTRINSPEIFPT